MTDLIRDDFLLKTATVRRLYQECAEGLPIIDYHNHLLDIAGRRAIF